MSEQFFDLATMVVNGEDGEMSRDMLVGIIKQMSIYFAKDKLGNLVFKGRSMFHPDELDRDWGDGGSGCADFDSDESVWKVDFHGSDLDRDVTRLVSECYVHKSDAEKDRDASLDEWMR